MSRKKSVEIEFVAPEAEITLEGNCVHDSTGTFRVLTLPDEGTAENVDRFFADPTNGPVSK
jgi:hypothetical protein